MTNHMKTTKSNAYAASLVAMWILARLDVRLLSLLGAVTAAITTVGLNA